MSKQYVIALSFICMLSATHIAATLEKSNPTDRTEASSNQQIMAGGCIPPEGFQEVHIPDTNQEQSEAESVICPKIDELLYQTISFIGRDKSRVATAALILWFCKSTILSILWD